MNFTKIALAAVATLAVVGQAQAGTRYLTGASATALNASKALIKLCQDAPNSGFATVFKDSTSTSALGNFFTVKCFTTAGRTIAKDFAGLTGTDTVAFNVDGGSFTAVEASTGNVPVKFSPAAGTTAITGSGVLLLSDFGAPLVQSTATGSQLSEGGFMDVEPAAFGTLIDSFGGLDALAPNVAPAAFNQVFGVAVSKALYDALQADQGLADGTDERAPAAQPTISRAQYATIVAADFNDPKTLGAAFLNLPVTKGTAIPSNKLTVCRRVSTSGTQAASNQYFLNKLTGGTTGVGGYTPEADAASFPATGPDALAKFAVTEHATTGLARTCLSSTSAYAIGVLSLENTPALTDNYRFVKLSRVEGFDVTTSASTRSKATAKTGEYDFVFNSQKYTAAGAGTSDVIEAIDKELSDLTAFNGLFGAADSLYNRGGNNANVITKKTP
ncbi:MAG: hypothetical protein RI920_1593 [Pseudomonadota bacterium]